MIPLRLRLMPKLIVVYMLYAAVVLAVVGILAFNSGQAALKKATFSGLSSTATEKEAALNQWIADKQTELGTIAASPYLITDLAEFVSTEPGSKTAHDRIAAELQNRAGQARVFLSLLVMEPETGKIIVATDAADEGKYRENTSYFINGQKEPYIQNPYYSLQYQGPAMTISMPIRLPDGQLLGVLAGHFNLAEINAIIAQRSGLQRSDEAFLVNSSNLFVTQPRLVSDEIILQRGIHTAAVARCLAGRSGVIAAHDYRGIPAIIAYHWLPERQLCLINKIDQAEAFEPQHALAERVAFAMGLALLLALLLGIGLARMVTRPIAALEAGAVRLRSGDLDVRLPETSHDEIGLLAREFNRMAAAIAEKETQLVRYASELENTVQQRTAALRESEERYRTVADYTYDWEYWRGPDGRILYMSPSCERISGYRAAEFIENPALLDTIVHPDDRHLLEQHQSLVAHQDIERWVHVEDFRIIRRDGEVRWIGHTCQIIRSGDGASLGRRATNRDITERKQAEDAFFASEAKYHHTLDAMLEGCQIIGVDWRYLYLNDVADQHNRRPKEELLGQRYMDMWPGIEATEVFAVIRRTMEEHMSQSMENEFVFPDGSKGWFEMRIYPVPEGTVVLSVDITERKQAEEAQRRYAEQLATINRLDRVISANFEIGMIYDNFVKELLALMPLDRTSIVLLNETEDQWQVARQWTQHQPVILPGEWRPVKGSAIDWVMTNRALFVENEIGERGTWLETAPLQREGLRSRLLLPLIIQERVVGALTAASREPDAFSEDDQHILTAIADQLAIAIQNSRLYEQVQRHAAELEQRVQERTAQLKTVNQELEAFAYSVSHDLRAPLRALDGFSAALLSQYQGQLDKQGQHYLDRIQEASRRMGQLINDLLNLSRVTRREMNRQEVDLSTLAREIAAELHTSDPQRQVEFVIADEITVQGDAPLLRIALENLLNNAWKFTGTRPQAHLEMGMTQLQDGERVYFVRDNGVGFDMAYANKLFAPFQRLHSMQEFPGTGIGLITVQRIITRHGGRIWTEAAVDQGATFYFTLGGVG